MQDLFFNFHSQLMDPDRIPYLIAAILLTVVAGMITGPVAGNANSFIWWFFDALFGRIGDRMDRVNRKKTDLEFRGLLFIVVLLLFALLSGQAMDSVFGPTEELVLVALCLTSGSVWYILLKLYFALYKTGKVEGAYYGLSRSSRVDLNSTDDFGITRVGLNFAAVSFDKGLVAPSIWYLIGGVPALLIYCIVSYAAWRFGKSGFSKGFGKVPMALEKLMGFIPSLFSGFLFSGASALTPTAKLHKALMSWWTIKGKAPYEEGGIVLSAIAWPLNVSLGGPVQDITGSSLQKMWIGPEGATAKLDHNHLKRGIYINVIAHLLFVFALLAAYVYAGKFL